MDQRPFLGSKEKRFELKKKKSCFFSLSLTDEEPVFTTANTVKKMCLRLVNKTTSGWLSFFFDCLFLYLIDDDDDDDVNDCVIMSSQFGIFFVLLLLLLLLA